MASGPRAPLGERVPEKRPQRIELARVLAGLGLYGMLGLVVTLFGR